MSNKRFSMEEFNRVCTDCGQVSLQGEEHKINGLYRYLRF